MRQVAAATAEAMQQEQKQNNGAFSGIAGMFKNLFGGGAQPQSAPDDREYDSESEKQSPIQRQQASVRQKSAATPKMKGPVGVDELLAELDLDISKVEMMSNVSASEISDVGDDASISGILLDNNKPKKKQKTSR